MRAPIKVITPLTRGILKRKAPSEKKVNPSRFTTISPFGRRTAIAIDFGDLIITPSITACPPTRRRPSFLRDTDSFDRE
jgi:hypothetical protein